MRRLFNSVFCFLIFLNVCGQGKDQAIFPLAVENYWKYEGQVVDVYRITKDTLMLGKKVLVREFSVWGKKRVEYVYEANDSVFFYNKQLSRFAFAWRQFPQKGDSVFYRDTRGKVTSVDASLKTPKQSYSHLVEVYFVDQLSRRSHIEYFKPGIGIVAGVNDDEIYGYLVKYRVKK